MSERKIIDPTERNKCGNCGSEDISIMPATYHCFECHFLSEVCHFQCKGKEMVSVEFVNAHEKLVLCLEAYLKITCGDCHGESAICDNRGQDDMYCALAEQARTAIAAAKGGECPSNTSHDSRKAAPCPKK